MPPRTPETLWYAPRPSLPVQLARALLAPPSWLYAAGAALHRSAFEAQLLQRAQLSARTVAVGNVVTGGSGKTPVIAALARLAMEQGVVPAVLSRGYGVQVPAEGRVVSTGAGPQVDVDACGDEPWMLARGLPGACVAVGPDRAAAARALVDAGGRPGVFLLDDAMQHHRVRADALVAVVKPPAILGNGMRLPAGPLRESPAGLRRADAVLVVGALDPETRAILASVGVDPARVHAVPLAVSHVLSADGTTSAPSVLAGVPVVATASIARPEAFLRTLEDVAADVRAFLPRADHAPFDGATVQELGRRVKAQGARALLMTEKDLVRWPRGADVGVPVQAVGVQVTLDAAARAALGALLLGNAASPGAIPVYAPGAATVRR